MVDVEVVLKMAAPSENVAQIAVRRRKPNPWFKRETYGERCSTGLAPRPRR
jgi:hypothetical protein